MGWTFMHRPKGFSDRAWVEREFGPEFSKNIVAISSTPSIMHIVIERDASVESSLVAENGRVRTCLILLTKWIRGDHYNWGYKDISEFSGPVETTCPVKLLDLLSPFEPTALASALASVQNDPAKYHPLASAYQWREKCREVANKHRSLNVGGEYTLPYMVRFSDTVEANSFTLIERKGRRNVFRRPDGVRVRLSRDILSALT